MNETFGFAAFRSRQQVLRFASALQRGGIRTQVISTPRAVAVGCGLSVRFALEDKERVMEVFRRQNPGNLIGFYAFLPEENGRGRITPL